MAEQDGDLSYTILVIFTAGNIKNVEETKRVLAEASESPLSVVIIGIGNRDFESMEKLNDHGAEDHGRDITTFACFDEYQPLKFLAEALMDQFPDQLVDFFIQRDIMPRQAVEVDKSTVEIMSADDDDRTVNFFG